MGTTEEKGLLKFITCGSVDDGKSTLIGHMLYESKLIFADQELSIQLESKLGATGTKLDYSLLLDGLSAEREQGITIDVAYRYFNTEKRSFIVADTPGHEEYTRNMAVGASFADLAVILVDVSQGLLPQTRRHVGICALMGMRHFVFALNKMDLVGYEEETFETIAQEIQALMKEIFHETCGMIPVSATEGDNVSKISAQMPWYTGRSLLSYLEEVDLSKDKVEEGFVLPVQRVSRPDAQFRGFQGQVAQGRLWVGDTLTVLPSGETAKVKQLFSTDQEVQAIQEGQAVTITLDKEVDCSRGCVMTSQTSQTILEVGRFFRCRILWMEEEYLEVGRNYWMKLGTKVLSATLLKIHHAEDILTGGERAVTRGKKNDILHCDLSLSENVVFSTLSHCPSLGRFLLLHRVTHGTSACGVISHSVRDMNHLTWHHTQVTPLLRAQQKGQTPRTIWFTGLSGSGKSTLANALDAYLIAQGKHTMLLDGDNVRMGLNENLGFSKEDREENIRRIAQVCKLMNDAGLIVLVAVISPFAKDRQKAREIIGEGLFQVYVDTSLEECEKRDRKGLYQKAREGKISEFTGISSPYEIPTHAHCIVKTEAHTVEYCLKQILDGLML